ncbi:phosphodiester glycosidase family protein [filamentous cyanobacterium LEGE 11480]|uniref:Phosphodiester glycosidase family protein n=1 Tax=Romeriopsis navalis LEGE 11480 TaxID=2777977 RepID=A0A928VM10_9CYAN|nr:phosphodiester glycosidase family protein [Romeriopsis navalis]MBE9028314.1 phosphodiester glycosidase family protein [Romeriopsis navalis LEGE 11480]
MQITAMRRWRVKSTTWVKYLLLILLVLPIVWQSLPYFQRPLRQPLTVILGPGVTYERIVLTQPRSTLLHVVKLDLTQPQLNFLVTPGQVSPDGNELNALTTTQFLKRYQQQLAINASFFYPFSEEAPWDYYPMTGDRANAVGYAVADGRIYSDGYHVPTWATICFDRQNRVQILPQSNCPLGAQQGLSGNQLILQAGRPKGLSENDKPYPRTIVGTDGAGQTLWLLIVDGKQPWYSEGLTIAEVIPWLQQWGVQTALNLDGGGSSTLAIATRRGAKLLNAPIHNKIPMTERPVANHLGVRWH